MKTMTKLIDTAGALVLSLVLSGAAYAGLVLGSDDDLRSAGTVGVSVEADLSGATAEAAAVCAFDQGSCPDLFLSQGDPWGQV